MSQAANMPLADVPPPSARGVNLLMIVIVVGVGFLWLAIALQLLFIVPRFEKLFLDFKMKLPPVTEWLIRDAWWGAPAGLIFWTAIGVTFTFSKRTRWIGLTLVIVVPLLLHSLILIGLYIPYAELVEALGEAPPF